MSTPLCSEEEFVRLWEEHRSPTKLANLLGCNVRKIHERRRKIEAKRGISLVVSNTAPVVVRHPAKLDLNVPNGKIVVFSDAHYYPAEPSTAHRALLALIPVLKPKVIVCNGDAFDGAAISRYPRIGWDSRPSVKDELRAVDERLDEIVKAGRLLRNACKFVWPLGNHDSRFETFLAANAPQYEGVNGFHLKDHFPDWLPCWAAEVNNNTVIKHRFKSGIHAAHNNTVSSGKNMVTGHLHSLKVTPWTDYNGTRYGVDTGTLADASPFAEQFVDYLEGNPVNWRSGFVVLTFLEGELLMPELVQVWDEDHVEFRGELIKV